VAAGPNTPQGYRFASFLGVVVAVVLFGAAFILGSVGRSRSRVLFVYWSWDADALRIRFERIGRFVR